MGFLTELFSRPRLPEHPRSSLALLHAMSHAERTDPAVRPADFPRIARQVAMR